MFVNPMPTNPGLIAGAAQLISASRVRRATAEHDNRAIARGRAVALRYASDLVRTGASTDYVARALKARGVQRQKAEVIALAARAEIRRQRIREGLFLAGFFLTAVVLVSLTIMSALRIAL